jgi:hypothetical protein
VGDAHTTGTRYVAFSVDGAKARVRAGRDDRVWDLAAPAVLDPEVARALVAQPSLWLPRSHGWFSATSADGWLRVEARGDYEQASHYESVDVIHLSVHEVDPATGVETLRWKHTLEHSDREFDVIALTVDDQGERILVRWSSSRLVWLSAVDGERLEEIQCNLPDPHYSADGTRAVALHHRTGALRVYDLHQGALLAEHARASRKGKLRACSSDGRLAAVESEGNLELWDLERGRSHTTPLPEPLGAAALGPTGRRVLLGGASGQLYSALLEWR